MRSANAKCARARADRFAASAVGAEIKKQIIHVAVILTRDGGGGACSSHAQRIPDEVALINIARIQTLQTVMDVLL